MASGGRINTPLCDTDSKNNEIIGFSTLAMAIRGAIRMKEVGVKGKNMPKWSDPGYLLDIDISDITQAFRK